MIPPTESNKGVAKWSLVADDNANSDDRINWAEGMAPSAVNDSARMMMTRIREQHDLNQSQFKSILDTVGGRLGNQIKAITADTYTITATSTANNWNFEFHFNDKLTLEEYNAYKAGNLYLLATLKATDLVNNRLYKQFSYNSIIYINLYFKIGSSVYEHIMMFKLNFFGIEKTNQSISFHELKEFVNCSTLQVGYANTSTNFISLPMKRTYTSVMDVTPVVYKGQRTYWWHESPDLVHIVAIYPAINSGGSSFATPTVTTFAADDIDGPQVKQGSGGQRRYTMNFPIPGPVQNVISTIMTQGWLYYGSTINETNGDWLKIEAMDFRSKYDGLLYSDGPGSIHVTTLNNGKHASEFPIHFSPTGIVENLIANVTPTN